MDRREFLLGALAATNAVALPATAQCQPIDLGIQNIPQQMSNWCWAAAAQQVIYWAQGSAPSQCALVAQANGTPSAPVCSMPWNANVPGHMQQIRFLIGQHVGAFTSLVGPGSQTDVYQTVASGRPIIMLVNPGFSQVGHFVVIRGVSCGFSALTLHINDPLGWPGLSSAIAYAQIAPIWQSAIIVG
ncbi:MAG: C39 family peptidase [Rubricella sp.]